jgi:hypothetical protein
MGQIGDFAPEFSTKKVILNQCTNFGARGVIFAQASRLRGCLTREEKRASESKRRISVLRRGAVAGFRAWDPNVEGLALPKFVENGNFNLNKLVIWWVSVQMAHPGRGRPTEVSADK